MLIGWVAHRPRLIAASFRTNKTKMNAIQCYVPTNDSDDKTKDQFNSRLQGILDKWKEKDVTILMGDFNVKVGTSIEQDCHQGQHFHTQKDTQDHMGVTRPCSREPERSYLHRQDIQEVTSRCESDVGSGCDI